MSEPVPIRRDVLPKLDVEREMLAFVDEKLNDYRRQYGEPPFAIAMVLVGPDKSDSASSACSWAPGNEDSSRLMTCSVASALLLKRAIGA